MDQPTSVSAESEAGAAESIVATGHLSAVAASAFARLEQLELHFVERIVDYARRRRLIGAARLVTRAGNGWIYPLTSLFLFAARFHSAARCLAAAATSLAIAFLIYPALKRSLARSRPCHDHAQLADTLLPLDRYSFPSGHAMTAAAFSLPIIMAAPAAAVAPIVAGCALVSWSRVALGHHYVSDILGGTTIGGLIGAAVAAIML